MCICQLHKVKIVTKECEENVAILLTHLIKNVKVMEVILWRKRNLYYVRT